MLVTCTVTSRRVIQLKTKTHKCQCLGWLPLNAPREAPVLGRLGGSGPWCSHLVCRVRWEMELGHLNRGKECFVLINRKVGFQKWGVLKKRRETAGSSSDLPLPHLTMCSLSEGLWMLLRSVVMGQRGKKLLVHTTPCCRLTRPSVEASESQPGPLPASSPTPLRHREGTKVSVKRESLQLIKSQLPCGEENSTQSPTHTCTGPRWAPRQHRPEQRRGLSTARAAIPGASSAHREA